MTVVFELPGIWWQLMQVIQMSKEVLYEKVQNI